MPSLRLQRLLVLFWIVLQIPFSLARPAGFQQDRTPDFQARVEWVPIDVIVLDRGGQPVLNLKQKDFTVLENGEKQEILYFSSHDWTGAEAVSSLGQDATPSIPPLLDPTVSKRRFVLLLGRGRHSAFHLTDALIRFVTEELGPDDPVAMVAFNRASNFTNDREKLREALRLHGELHESIHERLNLALSGMAALYGTGEIPESIQKDIDRIFEPFGGGMELRPAGVRSKGDARARLHQLLHQTQRADFAAAVTRASSGMPGSFSSTGYDVFENLEFSLETELQFDVWLDEQLKAKQDLLNLFSVVEYLRFVAGDKHVLYFTDDGFSDDGLFLPRLENEHSIASMASDARVRIHTFTTQGTDLGSYLSASADSHESREAAGAVPLSGGDVLKNTGPVYQPTGVIRSSRSKLYQQNGLMELSLRTGGLSFVHSDFRSSLGEVLGATRHSYLLAYQPRESFDTVFRRIEVRVRNKSARVLSRTGYTATSSPRLYDREGFMTYARTVQAFRNREPIQDIAFTCSVSDPVLVKNTTQLSARIHIDLKEDLFSSNRNGYVGTIAFTTFVLDESGQLAGQFWNELAFDVKDSNFLRWLAQGVDFVQPYQVDGKLEKGRLRIVLYNLHADRLGTTDLAFQK